MAKVLGEAGRYVTQEAVRKLRKIWTLALVATALGAAIWGMMVSLLFLISKFAPLTVSLLTLLFALLMYLIWKCSSRKLDELERERMQMRKGGTGEDLVASILGDLPEDYRVINDLTTPSGNLDHVVVGPTGVFIIETKNWRGVVAADGKRELLLNNKPTEKRCVSQFVGRMMGAKEKIKVLAREFDPYFQGLFVFTSARVEAKWGTTGNARCLRDDQLFDYIVDDKWNKKLTAREVDTLAQAFLALARMDAGFCNTEGAQKQTDRSGQIKLATAQIHEGI